MTDARLGVRNNSNVVTNSPTQYATGETFNALQDQTPTVLWFDRNNFCYLKPGTTQISTTLYDELATLAGTGAGTGSFAFGSFDGLLGALDLKTINETAVGFFDDFLGDTIASWLNTDTDANGTAALSATAGVHALELGTSTTDNEFITLTGGALNFMANVRLLLFEARLKISAVTETVLEFGWSDALSETAGLAFSSHDATPVDVASDAAILAWHADTGGSESTSYLSCLTVKNGGTPSQSFSTVALEANTYITLGVALNSAGDAGFYINGTYVTTVPTAIRTTVGLTPWVSVKTVDTSAKTLTVDYIRCYATRE